MKTRKYRFFPHHLLAASIVSGVSIQADAVNFNIGEIEGQFDSSLSIGASWAVRGPDPNFISNFNSQGKRGGASTRTGDDGGFNRSSQHLDRGVYGTTRRMDAKIDGPGSDAFSRCTLTS